MGLRELINDGLGYIGLAPRGVERDKTNPIPPNQVNPDNAKGLLPPGRVSQPPQNTAQEIDLFGDKKTLVLPGFQFEVIPKIRKLVYSNQDVSQALHNIVTLANTGHKIRFDSSVTLEKANEMREHLKDVAPSWHYGAADMNAIVNKLFAQAMIAGAICAEMIPNQKLTGIHRLFMPLPETIRFKYNKGKQTYEPYQLAPGYRHISGKKNPLDSLIKLNINTFRYYGINGDTELPYAWPPYLPAIPALTDQATIWENIKWIIQQMGAWGFLSVIAEVPARKPGENDKHYASRCEKHLEAVKNNILQGMRDGVVVGSRQQDSDEPDHKFEFNSSAKSAAGLSEVVGLNELKVSAGLKQDPLLTGKKAGGGAEGSTTVLFTKLLSEQVNIQSNIGKVLKDLYTLHLRLAGYSFKSLEIEWNPSTILDNLKNQQAQEIKIRNLRQLRMDGIISQDTYAEGVGVDRPYQQEPVVPFQPAKSTGDPNLDAEKKRVREKSKDTSDRRVRDKNKPQGSKKQ